MKTIQVILFLLFCISVEGAFAAPSCSAAFYENTLYKGAKIVLVTGTNRADSNSKRMTEKLNNVFIQAGADVTILDMGDMNMNWFTSDAYFGNSNRNFKNKFQKPFVEADGIFFVSPEYNGGMPGILKMFLDYVDWKDFKPNTPVGTVGVSAGNTGGTNSTGQLQAVLLHRGAMVVPTARLNFPDIGGTFDSGNMTDMDQRIERAVNTFAPQVRARVEVPQTQPVNAYQKGLAQYANSVKNKSINLEMDNGAVVSGQLTDVIVGDNETMAYVKFTGPVKIEHKGKVIPGQDVDWHHEGYSMPVGPIVGFKKGWHLKNNLAEVNFVEGAYHELVYESGATLTGTIKSMSYDSRGNLLVVTFKQAEVKYKGNVLYNPAWGDFDVAVGDGPLKITPR